MRQHQRNANSWLPRTQRSTKTKGQPYHKHLLLSVGLGMLVGIELSFLFKDSNWLVTPKWPAVVNLISPTVDNCSCNDKHLKSAGVEDNKMELSRIRILCWISTYPKNHETKAKHIKLTWGKRCDKLIFMSSKEDMELGAVALPNVPEGRDYLWDKTRAAFQHVWKNHKDEYDWFLKADDDTFVVMENLRELLSGHSPDSPLYMGCRVNGYMSGGAGYVLSKKALQRFVEDSLPYRGLCPISHSYEDMAMGMCLANVNVSFVDTRDSKGRHRFFPLKPEDILTPVENSEQKWWQGYRHFPIEQGLNCCSESPISFHYVNPRQLYVLEYLIYHLKPVRAATDDDPPQTKISDQTKDKGKSSSKSINLN